MKNHENVLLSAIFIVRLGETFDKTAKMIGLEFPGGPKLEKLAKHGDEKAYILPKPILNHPGCNLSFAGLKTSILNLSSKIKTGLNLASDS